MSALTAMKLNEQIVSMRKVVEKGRVRLCRRLIRQAKIFQKSKTEKKTRKVQRIVEEIDLCKKMPRDDVSKFALVNLKPLHDLLKKDRISPDERVLYKLACQETVLKSVNEFRAKYPNWQHEIPFLLQRLGLQYKSKRDAKKIMRNRKEEVMEEGGSSTVQQTPTPDDVKTLVKKEIRKAARKEENLEKKKKKNRKPDEPEEKPRPIFSLPKPELPKSVVTRGQAVIKVLRLDGNSDEVFPSTSPSDGTEDTLEAIEEGNENDNGNNGTATGNDGIIGSSSPPIKTKKVRKRRKDFEQENLVERSTGLKKQKNPGNIGSIKELPETVEELPENENLHPSWIAKKKQRETQKKLKGLAKARKIVFDDD